MNHPHIAAIHGLEDSDGTHALVLELVEGETLADRIARGPIPLDEALPLARQICEALEAAHEKGIIHRDLKPANIKVTPDDQVKVLDFGLAKLTESAGSGQQAAGGPHLSMSPTITSPAMMTGAGVILGTAAYMSPEQAKGRDVDKRSDIWAFGCVLFEMLSGKRAFEGDDVSDTLASVLKGQPDWAALPPDTPAAVATLLRGCLEKDQQKRLAESGTASFMMAHAGEMIQPIGTPVAGRHAAGRSSSWRRAAPVAAALIAGAFFAGGSAWMLTRPAAPAVIRTTLTASGPSGLSLDGTNRDIAITADGSRIAYRGGNRLLVRALDQLEPKVLVDSETPRDVFVSPDGQWMGFAGGNAIRKVAITGGPAVTIASNDGTGTRGATWGPDGSIILATGSLETGLMRVPAAGGTPMVLTKPDREHGEADHVWPQFLPGGRAVLFTITLATGAIEDAEIAVLDLQTGTSKVLIRGGSDARYVPPGYLAYGVSGTVRAVPFDLGRLEVTGTPAPVIEGVVTTAAGALDLAVTANGTLAYVPGTGGVGGVRTVVAIDRQGRASALAGIPLDSYRDVRVSPDGTRVALATQSDIWTYPTILPAVRSVG